MVDRLHLNFQKLKRKNNGAGDPLQRARHSILKCFGMKQILKYKGTRDPEDHLLPNSQFTGEETEAQRGYIISHMSLQLWSDPAFCFVKLLLCIHYDPCRATCTEASGVNPALCEGTQGRLGAGTGH